ncbi:hypothetical protein TQ38_008625 [Novosphingobium sp. P6W]|nr:hypothetical protein TQ38_008625 [Novosphingobium sp. P6W]
MALLPVVFSILIALGVVLELRGMNMAKVLAMVPRAAGFWMVFAASYFAGPASEWLIYRRLWQLPAEGFAALLRKLVCNELLLGYLGEAYFYTWARQRSAMTAAPFGAIKDVSILSAMVGNAVTLALLVALWPFLCSTAFGFENRAVMLSLSVVLATSIAAMALRRRIFSLNRDVLGFITSIHLLRIVVTTILSAVLWHMVLPAVPVSWWLLLATLRLLISRLPFIPNKDVVFAGVAVFTLGHETDIAALMTMMASAILLVHLLLGLALAASDLLRRAMRV